MNDTRINAINVRRDLSKALVSDIQKKGDKQEITFTPKLWLDIAVNAEIVCETRFDAKKRIKGWRA